MRGWNRWSEMWLLSGSGGRHNMRRLPEGTEERCKNLCGTCTYPGKESKTAVKPCNDLQTIRALQFVHFGLNPPLL